MEKLNEKEMLEVTGGSVSVGLVATIAGAIVFIAGLISGYTNPASCND